MKNEIKKLSGILMLALLGACGGNNNVPGYGYGAGFGNCVIAGGGMVGNQMGNGYGVGTGLPDRTLVASFGNGATLTLYIQTLSAGTISASGRLVVPSVQSLFQDPSGLYGGASTLATGGIDQCVSSNGAVGTMQYGSAYEEIQLSLRGQSVYIELGSGHGGVPPYIVNENIEGSVWLELPPYPGTLFAVTRP